jgi:hypothetical protein
MPPKTPKSIEQCLYDELMQFCLETVSSGEWLTDCGIYRSEIIQKSRWPNFTKKMNKQEIKPGIYPRSFGGGSIHFYAVRRQGDFVKIGNGYSNSGGVISQYADPLQAQADYSNGLCQTFALMYYENQSHLLKKGKFSENVVIGLKWLVQFVKKEDREVCWDAKYMETKIVKHCEPVDTEKRLTAARIKLYKTIYPQSDGDICLSSILQYLLNHRANLQAWFEDDW